MGAVPSSSSSFISDGLADKNASFPALPTGSKKGGSARGGGGEGEKEEKRQVDKNFFVIVVAGAVVLIYDARRVKAGGTFFALYARASKTYIGVGQPNFPLHFVSPIFSPE